MKRYSAILLAGLAALALGAPDSPPGSALADYVAEPDASFEWRIRRRYSEPRAEIIELYMQSQTWRGIAWKHQLYLIKSVSLGTDVRQGLLVIGGGRWSERYQDEIGAPLPEGSELFVEIANRLGTFVAVLGQVPFQPSFGLTEDHLIAHSLEQYLASGDSEWPLLLPMVKSAVRAMDATQAATAAEWGAALERFTVLGGSKRGWTAWLTGAVDLRAAILVPLVIDALNFAEHMPHQTAVWGAPSDELSPYSERGLVDVLAAKSGAGADLRTIVDPYSYRERLTQPKLIVVATNDAYFPLDSMNLYWNDLPGPKYALYLPNEGHDIEDPGRLIATLNAVHRSAASGGELPDLAWQFERYGEVLRLCLRAEPVPASVLVWTAVSADADFRNVEFVPAPVTPGDDILVFDLPPAEDGFRAVFAESIFGEGDAQYSLSTNVRIVAAAGEVPDSAASIDGTPGVCP